MTPALALLFAYVLDAGFGEPPNALHPVVWIGNAVGRGRDWALGGAPRMQFVRGALLTFAVCAMSAVIAYLAIRLAALGPAALTVVLSALFLKPLFAVRALREAAFKVRDALEQGDLDGARRALSSLCSRDATSLGPDSVAAAAIESLAENASDSIVAPVVFFGFLGLPGAAFYRAANTLDAMIGYRGRFEWTGKAAARLDDALNFVPARITAALLLAAGFVCDGRVRNGVRVLLRDGGLTESPNAGRPMAAMAGLLGVQLTKTGHYALGDAERPVEPADITRAWRLVSVASFSAVLGSSAALGWMGATR